MPKLSYFSRPEADTCEYVGPGVVYWSRGPKILVSKDIYSKPHFFFKIPRPFFRNLLAKYRLGRRLGRETFYNLIPLSDGGLFYTYANEVGFISSSGELISLKGRSRHHRVLRGGAAKLPDNSIVFGEYIDNSQREEVRIYRAIENNPELQQVYAFASGDIRHIHSVSWDPFAKCIVVCTGDLKSECRIITFDSNFKLLKILGSGTENWRTISPQFTPDAIYFGTDAQFSPNKLFRYDRITGILKELSLVNGPVFYSLAIKNGFLFATTAELCPSQSSPEAILYFVDSKTNKVSIVKRFLKDIYPTRYFQFGIINFPITCTQLLEVPISGVALKGFDSSFLLINDFE
jgi:hypothetical protein